MELPTKLSSQESLSMGQFPKRRYEGSEENGGLTIDSPRLVNYMKNVNEQRIFERLAQIKYDTQKRREEELKDYLSNRRMKKKISKIRKLMAELHSKGIKSQENLIQRQKDFFYDRNGSNVFLTRYTDYANDAVQSQIIRYVMDTKAGESDLLAFANNANIKGGVQFNRLLRELEHEILEMNRERVQLEKVWKPTKVSEIKAFRQKTLKHSRLKDQILDTQKGRAESNQAYARRQYDGRYTEAN